MLAIGGMTALYPSREDAELNARALAVLEKDKKNEATSLDGRRMDRPSRSERNRRAASSLLPTNCTRGRPITKLIPTCARFPQELASAPLHGTRAAVRTVIRYRHGVLSGRGASLLDGYMEDLATDRIYRLMIAQRMRHRDVIAVLNEQGEPVAAHARIRHAPFRRGTQAHPARASLRLARGDHRALHAGAPVQRKNDFDERVQSVVVSADRNRRIRGRRVDKDRTGELGNGTERQQRNSSHAKALGAGRT